MCNILAASKHVVPYGNHKKFGMVEAADSWGAVLSGEDPRHMATGEISDCMSEVNFYSK